MIIDRVRFRLVKAKFSSTQLNLAYPRISWDHCHNLF